MLALYLERETRRAEADAARRSSRDRRSIYSLLSFIRRVLRYWWSPSWQTVIGDDDRYQ